MGAAGVSHPAVSARAETQRFVPASTGRLNDGPALAEADAHGAFLGAVAAEDDLVAVFDEAALLAAGQIERLAAAGGEFEQAAPARFLRTRHRTRSEQVADLQVAAVAGVVRDHLRDGP